MEILVICFLSLLVFGGIFTLWNVWWAGIILLILGIVLTAKSFKKIPADPPNLGLVTIWGERINKIKKEGLRLVAPYFPFFFDVILIDMTKKNKDFVFENVRCIVSENIKTDATENGSNIRSGGSTRAVVSITWVPDKDRLISYVNSGKQKGVEQIVSDKMAEVIRQMGRNHNWEQMTFATDVMSANLIISIVGIDNVKDDRRNEDDWRWGERIRDHIADNDLEDAMDYLHKALSNGVADSHDLGIKIRRLNVKQVEPEGELRQDAEKSAREVQDRRAEVFELETELKLAQKLFDTYVQIGKSKNFEECVLEIRRRKVIREGYGKVIDIAGISPELVATTTNLLKGGKI